MSSCIFSSHLSLSLSFSLYRIRGEIKCYGMREGWGGYILHMLKIEMFFIFPFACGIQDTASEPPMLDDDSQHKSSHTSSNMADKIFSDRNCNGSENFPLFPKTILSPALEAETESGNSYRREFRSKRWTNKVKIKFKETTHSHIRVVSATDDVVPLLLPNIMDKL